MGEKIRIPIAENRDLLRTLYTANGIAIALESLPAEGSTEGRYPGVALARAKIEALLAQERARVSSASLRAVAKAGHDITQAKSVHTIFEGGKETLEVEMYDLADMAEGD
jgi:hypothetical protein